MADDGWAPIEVQHLLTPVAHGQFDTIHHEYLHHHTVLTGHRALAAGGLSLVGAERLPAGPAGLHRGPHSLHAGPVHPGDPDPGAAPERIAVDRPDYVLVLPWNLRDELVEQLSYVRDWGGRLVFPIPTLEIVWHLSRWGAGSSRPT